MPNAYIKFYDNFVQDILTGAKTQTIRYGWKSIPSAGDIVDAIASDSGEVFAKIKIAEIDQLTIQECANRDFEGHINYSTPEEVVSSMREYYDDIDMDSTVICIEFEVVESNPNL